MTDPGPLSYALITPVRNEEAHLPRLARAVAGQTVAPRAWLIVDAGSTDATPAVTTALGHELPFVRALDIGAAENGRGGPVVRGFQAGLAALDAPPDVVVKLDADLSFDADYFERLMTAFADDPRLGLASGICTELRDGQWRPLFGTRGHVWGASRAYRWTCLPGVLPLEERQGWDEIDSIKAQLRGWHVGTLADVAFRHHRPEGARDGSSRRRWAAQGDTAHYMGYRFSYLLARAAWRAARGELAALAMLEGYARAVARREPRCDDGDVIAHLRREQSPRRLTLRLREALGQAI